VAAPNELQFSRPPSSDLSSPAVDHADLSLPWRVKLTTAVFVAVFAFLLASLPARNSDLWQHLARGRHLFENGQLALADFGEETLANGQRSWLYDLSCYSLYSAIGGPALVFCNALLVAGLGLVLFGLSQVGPGWRLAAFTTVLALLAISMRLLVQPATVSLLLLALTIWILQRPVTCLRARDGPDSPSARRTVHLWPLPLPPWPLFLLFIIWVNVDSWFVLGLLTVAMVWVGQALDAAGRRDETKATRPSEAGSHLLQALSLLLILGAACLLNPAHVHAFALPRELEWFGLWGVLAPAAASTVATPFQGGLSTANLAYFSLLGLGLLSFVLNLPRWRWQRFLPWLVLALLSALQARMVPFFAVIAGPVLAWNLREWSAARRVLRDNRLPTFAIRLITAVLGLALIVCAWPGWLQTSFLLAKDGAPPRWAIEIPSSLECGAAVTKRWRQQGKLGPEAPGLHLSLEAARAFAWLCPEHKGVFNKRLADAVMGVPGAPADWIEQMRRAGFNHAIVYDADGERLITTLGKLWSDPEQWPMLYLEGRLAVFGWRDPGKAGAKDLFRGWELDPIQLAFSPQNRKAPATRPKGEAESRPWYAAFWQPAPPRPVDREEASLYLLHAEVLRGSAPRRHLTIWEMSQSAAFVAAAGGWFGPSSLLDPYGRLVLFRPRLPRAGQAVGSLPPFDQLALKFQERFRWQRDDTSPALLLLAVRAARRALAVNPADARAHLILGESYLHLLHHTRERAWGKRMSALVELRQAQASWALNQAVYLEPNSAQAHFSLAGLYQEMGYIDLALEHLRIYFKLVHEAGPSTGVSAEQFREQKMLDQNRLLQLAGAVEIRASAFAAESDGLRVRDRAFLALKKGLARRARDLLLESHVSAFGRKGMALELELLLSTGRAKEVGEWTDPEQRPALGTMYHWLRARAFAAAGDYAMAKDECVPLGSAHGWKQGPRQLMARIIAQTVLDEQLAIPSLAHQVVRVLRHAEFQSGISAMAENLKQEANAGTLRGVLALEEGDVKEAKAAFDMAFAVWKESGLDFDARIIAQSCLQWLNATSAPAGDRMSLTAPY